MNRKIEKIAELKIDIDNLDLEGLGVDIISFVNDPAIQVGWQWFNKEEFIEPQAGEDEGQFISRCMSELESEYPDQEQRLAVCYSYFEGDDQFLEENPCQDGWVAYGLKPKGGRMVPNCIPVEANQEFQSYTDYPEAVKDNAARGIRLNEAVNNKCATRVGKIRAQQLAQGEAISFETVKRMYSYLSRAAAYYKPEDTEACGTISYLLWGGEEALRWSERKIREQEEMTILKWAEEHGTVQDESYIEISLQQEFNTVGNIAKAIVGLDILGKLGIKQGEEGVRKYKYTGPAAERGFCKALMRLNKLYSPEDIQELERRLSLVNPGMGPGGRDRYNVFLYKGGVNCRHYWSQTLLFKPAGQQRVVMLNEGPAQGLAGKSNNRNEPSPGGHVGNNASLKFSIEGEERIVAGPIMIPNKFIIRRSQTGQPKYVYFSKETIKKMQEKWSQEMKWNQTDVNHDGQVVRKNTLLEQWVIEDPNRDKSNSYYGFYDLPRGTWFGVYRVNDDETWQKIKEGKLNGFSIEGNFVEQAKEVEPEQMMQDIINILDQIDE